MEHVPVIAMAADASVVVPSTQSEFVNSVACAGKLRLQNQRKDDLSINWRRLYELLKLSRRFYDDLAMSPKEETTITSKIRS